jgi:hypothetical protein
MESVRRTDKDFNALLAQSEGMDGLSYLSSNMRSWIAGLGAQIPKRFWIHRDAAARLAAARVGATAFVLGDRIFLGGHDDTRHDAILRHELVHLAQVQLALASGRAAASALTEYEADEISCLPASRPVRYGADPHQLHPIVWFIAIGAGLYVLLRPSVANAPGPGDRTIRSPSPLQILGEALCLFAVPGGALAFGGRLGLGFLGSMALAGATSNVGLRAVSDVSRGQASSPLMYLFDAATGAVIGFVVPGGFRLIGRAGTHAFDRLATYGLSRSDIAITRTLSELAPVTAAEARQILATRGFSGNLSQWWLNRRGLIVLYRGQGQATDQILSPLARQESVAASEALVERLRRLGLNDQDIAGFTARWHNQPVPGILAPPGMGGQPIGAAGIPATNIPGVAANFGEGGVIYVIRLPRSAAINPIAWQGLAIENEFIILNQVPRGSVVQAIPANRVAPLLVDENGLLISGAR